MVILHCNLGNMSPKKYFLKTAKTSLVLVYLVIIAGAVVRMTGSGMGCPDWPQCFGYYIPPTHISEVQWQADSPFEKGQIIIVEKALQVAKNDLTTKKTFDKNNWEPYLEHDYAEFNPVKTWIEYINRLATVLLGIPMLLMLLFSFWWYQKDKIVTFFSIITIVVLGLQAVLGKLVVDTNLKPTMISVHMILALVIMLLLLFLINRTSEKSKVLIYDKGLTNLLVIATVITFFQIILGIQVRQFVDFQIDLFGENAKNLWLQNPTLQFFIHRSASILITLLNVYLAYHVYKKVLGYSKINWVLIIIVLEVITGMAMYYLDFPIATQPLHLVLASLLFGVQFYLVLEALKSKRSHKTL